MIRKAFVMQVNADAHEEYQRRHNPIWPELEAVLKSHGAHHYAIYLDQERNLLFATVEIESEERWNAVASTDVCQRWWKHMRDVMPANPDNSPVSAELKRCSICSKSCARWRKLTGPTVLFFVGRIRRLRRHPAISILLRYQDSLSIRFQRFKDMRLVAGITNVIALRQLFRRLG